MKKISIILFTALLLTGLTACGTTKEIPEDLSSAQLLQNGQSAVDSGDYTTALRYYNTVLERFGTDTETYIITKYEIGHLYFKQKKYDLAKPYFTEIIDIYNEAPYGSLPPAYKKLSQLQLEQIPD